MSTSSINPSVCGAEKHEAYPASPQPPTDSMQVAELGKQSLPRPKPILTSIRGNSADAMADIAAVHVREGARVLDLTYGRGVFWRKLPNLNVTRCDRLPLKDVQVIVDSTEPLPFADQSFDVVVLDPPYMRGANSKGSRIHRNLERCYRNNQTSDSLRKFKFVGGEWRQLMFMYQTMLHHASSVVKHGGLIVVKGMDDKQNWFLRDLHIPQHLKLISVHILTSNTTPIMRHSYQKHARKNHSYFLVLKRKNSNPEPMRELPRRSRGNHAPRRLLSWCGPVTA